MIEQNSNNDDMINDFVIISSNPILKNKLNKNCIYKKNVKI